MFRTINDFLQSWQIEAETTSRLLNNLTDESLAYGNEHFPRGVARLSQHLAESIPAFMETIGNPIEATDLWKTPTSKTEVLSDYKQAVEAARNEASKFTDESMTEIVPFFGRQLPRGAALAAMIGHQAHHRGQLTVLMREAGLPGTNVAGPTKEDWVKMGHDPRP